MTVSTVFGYLADPYKGVHFDGYDGVNGTSLFDENRPGHKSKKIGFVSLTQHFTPLHASVEASWRIYHDSYGIWAHTAALEWRQQVGKHFLLVPMARFYDQSAAEFYVTRVARQFGSPNRPRPGFPDFYSADYRLSELSSWTYGLQATWKVNDHLSFDAAFKRYEMSGRDGVTAASAYPTANVYTLGLSVWF